MGTIWKDIAGYDGVYKISNRGRVRSFKCGKERILRNGLGGNGYYHVVLSLKGKTKTSKIHKLMQTAFNMGEGHVDHINGDKLDNQKSNLRIVTHRENMHNMKSHRGGRLVGATICRARRYIPTPWKASIYIDGKKKHLGTFPTEQLAHEAYMKAFKEIPTES